MQLNEISVEAAGRGQAGPALAGTGGANMSGGDGNSAATSGGGGGPSGVTGYVARVSPTATKTNTPLIETPQSVSVVTREQLNDRNVQSLNEALAYTPGVVQQRVRLRPALRRLLHPRLRGDQRRRVPRRPAPARCRSGGGAVEPYGAEALTILRGPASGLYGLGSPGGIVDITSKRPVFVPFGEVWFQGGNFDRYRAISTSAVPSRGRTAPSPTG